MEMRGVRVLILILLFSTAGLLSPSLHAEGSDTGGDEKIRGTIDRIEEEERRQKEKEREKEEGEEEETEEETEEDIEEEEDESESILDVFVGAFFNAVLEFTFTVRYADFPYSEKDDFRFTTSAIWDSEVKRSLSLNLSSDLAYHFDGTFGSVNRAALQLSALHVNLYNQFIFAESESISILSVNGGLTFFVPDVMINGYLGVYTLDVLDRSLLSYGFSAQVFLPAKLWIDIYNVNANFGELNFNHLILGLNYAPGRINLGLGYHINWFAGDIYAGPSLRFYLWL
jgi:hypothetical protein